MTMNKKLAAWSIKNITNTITLKSSFAQSQNSPVSFTCYAKLPHFPIKRISPQQTLCYAAEIFFYTT